MEITGYCEIATPACWQAGFGVSKFAMMIVICFHNYFYLCGGMFIIINVLFFILV